MVDRGIQTLKKNLATRVARKGGQWSDHFERAAGAHSAAPASGCKAAGRLSGDFKAQNPRLAFFENDSFRRNPPSRLQGSSVLAQKKL